MVDADAPGLAIAERIETIAPHPLATLRFEGCRVPRGAPHRRAGRGLQGRDGDARRLPLDGRRRGARLRPARPRRGARPRTSRQLFGAPLADLQLTQAALADMATDVDAAGAPRLPRRLDEGPRRRARHARGGDGEAATPPRRRSGVIDDAVQLLGGLGVTTGVKVEQLYREIRALRIYEGATRSAEDRHRARDRGELAAERAGRAGSALAHGGFADSTLPHGEVNAMQPSRPMSTPSRATTCRRRSNGRTFRFTLPELQYPERLNCARALLDRWIADGHGDAPCLVGPARRWTYRELDERVEPHRPRARRASSGSCPAIACCCAPPTRR